VAHSLVSTAVDVIKKHGSETGLRKTFQAAQSQAFCRKFPDGIKNCCGQDSGQKVLV